MDGPCVSTVSQKQSYGHVRALQSIETQNELRMWVEPVSTTPTLQSENGQDRYSELDQIELILCSPSKQNSLLCSWWIS